METIGLVVMTMLFTAGVIATGFCVYQFIQHKKKLEVQMTNLENLLAFIAKGHQLSTIFDIKGATLRVSPEQFEANKEALLLRIEKAVAVENHPDPGTWAYCVINHSGLEEFLDGKTRSNLQKAMGRLRANDKTQEALEFAKDVIDQLNAPEKTVH